MDDILIHAANEEELEQRTKEVFRCLCEQDLYLKPKKCEFKKTRVEYLGMIIEEGKIAMDPVKLGGIRDWPILTTVKQAQSFLGLSTIYCSLLRPSMTVNRPYKERQDFRMDHRMSNSF